MAYVDIYPLSSGAETTLTEMLPTIRELIRIALKEVWQRPDEDIIIVPHRCDILERDPVAIKLGSMPDLKITINTSDPLQHLAKALGDALSVEWEKKVGRKIKFEIWIDFFHTWKCSFMK